MERSLHAIFMIIGLVIWLVRRGEGKSAPVPPPMHAGQPPAGPQWAFEFTRDGVRAVHDATPTGSTVVFTPTPNYFGPASFDYVVEDDGTTNGGSDALSDTGHVTFTITA